jgi:drug/metabolite transporter (DMT)-like permease
MMTPFLEPGVSVLGVGEFAALAGAATFAGCTRCFAVAGRSIGSQAVSFVRLSCGTVLLLLLHLILIGPSVPAGLGPTELGLFAASGLVGLAIGDGFLFRALVLIGPGPSTLMMTTAPAWAALLAAIFLGERLPPLAWLGLALTLLGIAWAVRQRRGALSVTSAQLKLGLFFAGLGALGQGAGIVLAKPALESVPALTGTLVRMLASCLAMAVWMLFRASKSSEGRLWWGRLRSDRRVMGLLLLGTFLGPAGGVWLSLIATQRSPVAVAATLLATTPLFVFFVEFWLDARRPGRGELGGALLAVAGVSLLVAAA